MATKVNKVTAGEVVSATRKYSNKDDADRRFNISADVNIRNGNAVHFNNGSLTSVVEPASGSANFSKGEGWFSLNANNLTDNEAKEAFDAILDFIAYVNEDVESIPVE